MVQISKVDEWRDLAGKGPLGGDAGNKHIIPRDMVPVDLETFTPEDLAIPGSSHIEEPKAISETSEKTKENGATNGNGSEKPTIYTFTVPKDA